MDQGRTVAFTEALADQGAADETGAQAGCR